MSDEDEELLTCYRHSNRETALRCQSCERPICVDCGVTAAVGIKCPDCARMPRAALGKVPPGKLVTGALGGAGVALGIAALHVVVGFAFSVGFFALVLAFLVGMGAGELVRRSAGGYRDPLVARIAAASAAAGFLLGPALTVVRYSIAYTGALGGEGIRLAAQQYASGLGVIAVVSAAVAAWGAYRRAS